MKKIAMPFILGMLIGTAAFADGNVVGTIKSVSTDKNKALVTMSKGASLWVGQHLQVTSDCQVTVQKVKEDQVIVDSEMCMDKSVLTAQRELFLEGGHNDRQQPSGGYHSYEESMAASARLHEDIANGFALFGSIQSTSAAVSVSVDGDTYTGTTDSSAQSLAIEAGYLAIHNGSLGYIARLTYGTKVAGDGWSSFNYLRPEISGTYGFNDKVYLYLGLNGTKYSAPGLFDDIQMGIGGQLGVGFKVQDRALIELAYITSYHNYTDTFGTVSVDFGSLALSMGYVF